MKYSIIFILITLKSCVLFTSEINTKSGSEILHNYELGFDENNRDLKDSLEGMQDIITYKRDSQIDINNVETRFTKSWNRFFIENYELLGNYLENDSLSRFIKFHGIKSFEKKIKEEFFTSLNPKGIQEIEFTIMDSYKILSSFSYKKTKISEYKISLLPEQSDVFFKIDSENVFTETKLISFGNKNKKHPRGKLRYSKLNYGDGITIIIESIFHPADTTSGD